MKKRRKSILFDWALSYMFVALIPLLMIFFNYYLNMKTIRSEICNINEVILENLGGEIDRMIETQKNIYNWLYVDDAFSSWIMHDEKSAEFHYDASELRKQINNYLKYSGNVDCLVYKSDESYVVGKGFADDMRHKYTALQLVFSDFVPYETWKEQLDGEYRNEIIFGSGFHSGTEKRCMVLANTITVKSEEPVNVFISVPLADIEEMVEGLETSAYLVMSYGNTVEIINGTDEMLTPQVQEAIASGKQIFSTKEYVVLNLSSAHKNLTYSILIKQSDFWQKSTQSRLVFGVGILATLLLTYVMVRYLLKRNFKPVSSLLEKTSGEVGSETSKENEFYQIELAYSKLKSEKKSMQQIVDKQKENLLGNYLLSIMKNRKAGMNENELHFFDMDGEISLILCGFNITEDDDLLRFAVDNVFAELMETERSCHMEDGNYLLYVFLVTAEDEARFLIKCEEAVRYTCSLFGEKWGTQLEFHRTEREEGLENLVTLYRSFTRAVAEKANADKLLAEKARMEQNPYRNKQNAAGSREKNAAGSGREKNAAGSSNDGTGQKDWQEDEDYAESGEELQEDDVELLPENTGEIQGIVAEVYDYVAEHFNDSGLNIAAIADALERNPKYISKVFKDTTGDSILDYLNRIRIERAKELIATRRYTTEEAGMLAGYASNQTFRRAFAKVVGMTPGKYAEKLQKGGVNSQNGKYMTFCIVKMPF